MVMAPMVALWLVQAPLGMSSHAPPVTSPPREWDLAGAFTLKQENFLTWQPVFDPMKGWQVELRPMWTLELAPTHPRAANFSLMLESLPAPDEGFGLVRPKVQLRVPNTEVRVGVKWTGLASFSSAGVVAPRLARPMAFLSGRF